MGNNKQKKLAAQRHNKRLAEIRDAPPKARVELRGSQKMAQMLTLAMAINVGTKGHKDYE